MKNEEGWKIIKVTSIPDCDKCKKPEAGVYDAPTCVGGSWANLCEECIKITDIENSKLLGTKKVIHAPSVAKYPPNRVIEGKEISDLEAVVMEECNREIECPECGEIREVEPDARYTFKCEGCGVNVRCPSIM